jgi:hypothetical protein
VQDLAKGLDDKSQVDAVLLDFSKAFDKVPHLRLSKKLEHYGVRGNVLYWIQDFLADRSQKVVCEGHQSTSANVMSGVPQGTVLGPLLFLAYINDLPDATNSTIRLFADDALLYRRINSISDAEKLQEDLIALQEWENKWQMSFNPDKCEVLRITQKKKNIIDYRYSIHGHTLALVSQAKYLGVTLDSKLTFNPHIDNICKKANRTRAFVHRNTKQCPRYIKTAAYNTMVRPQLEYCSSVWSPKSISNIDKVQAVQPRAVRSVMKDWSIRRPDDPVPSPAFKGSPSEMQKFLEWATLEERRAKAKITMFYKIIEDLIDIPHSILRPNPRDSRQHNRIYHVITVNSSAYQNSFFPSTTIMWNSLPLRIVNSPSLETLKYRLTSATIIPSSKY